MRLSLVPDRPVRAESPAYEQVSSIRQEAEADASRFTTGEFDHTQTGEPLFVASLKQRSPDFKELSAVAKRNGGYYSGYKRDGAIPGFIFKSEEARASFIEEVEGSVDMMSVFGDGKPSVQNPLDSLYDANGDIDYERIQDTVTAIYEGEYRIERLTLAGEEGRLAVNNRLLVGASLVIGAGARTSNESGPQKRRNREEEVLEAYARSQNAWIDDIEAFKRSLDQALPRHTEVLAYKSGNSVIKIAPIPDMDSADSSILRFFDDKIALHNTIPNAPPYECAFRRCCGKYP